MDREVIDFFSREGFEVKKEPVGYLIRTGKSLIRRDDLYFLEDNNILSEIETEASFSITDSGVDITEIKQNFELMKDFTFTVRYPSKFFLGGDYRHIPYLLREVVSENFTRVKPKLREVSEFVALMRKEGLTPSGTIEARIKKKSVGSATVIEPHIKVPLSIEGIEVILKFEPCRNTRCFSHLELEFKIPDNVKEKERISTAFASYLKTITYMDILEYPVFDHADIEYNPIHPSGRRERIPVSVKDILRVVNYVKKDLEYIVSFYRGTRGRKDILERIKESSVFIPHSLHLLVGSQDSIRVRDPMITIKGDGLWYEGYRMEDVLGFEGTDDLSFDLLASVYMYALKGFLLQRDSVSIEKLPPYAEPILEQLLLKDKKLISGVFMVLGDGTYVIDRIKNIEEILSTLLQGNPMNIPDLARRFFRERFLSFMRLMSRVYNVKPLIMGGDFVDISMGSYVSYLSTITYAVYEEQSLLWNYGLKDFRRDSYLSMTVLSSGNYYVLLDGVSEADNTGIYWVGKKGSNIILPIKIKYTTPNLRDVLVKKYERQSKSLWIKLSLDPRTELSPLVNGVSFPVIYRDGKPELIVIEERGAGKRVNRVKVRG